MNSLTFSWIWATGPLSAELLLEGVKEGLAAANLSMFDLTGLRTVLTILAPFFSITVLTLEGISFWTLEVKVEKTEGLIGGLGTGTLGTKSFRGAVALVFMFCLTSLRVAGPILTPF